MGLSIKKSAKVKKVIAKVTAKVEKLVDKVEPVVKTLVKIGEVVYPVINKELKDIVKCPKCGSTRKVNISTVSVENIGVQPIKLGYQCQRCDATY